MALGAMDAAIDDEYMAELEAAYEAEYEQVYGSNYGEGAIPSGVITIDGSFSRNVK